MGVLISLTLASSACGVRPEAPGPSPAPPPAPAPPSREEPALDLRVVVLSDFNGQYGSMSYDGTVHRAVARTIALAPQLVLSAGDMVAGQRAGLDYQGMWSSFHAAVTHPLRAAGVPLAVAPGNHDASGYRRYAEERRIYVEEWRRERPDLRFVDDSHYPLRYSFLLNDILFVALDATRVGPLADAQRRWLETQLEHDARARLVFGHLPLHPFTVGREAETLDDPELETLFAEHEVTLYISGHHHAYYPGRAGGLRVVSVSCLGGGPRRLIGTDTPAPRGLLVIDLQGGRIRSLEALSGPELMVPISRSTLPGSIGAVTRDDLI